MLLRIVIEISLKEIFLSKKDRLFWQVSADFGEMIKNFIYLNLHMYR